MKISIVAITILSLCFLLVSCQSDEQVEFKRYHVAGEAIYKQKCQNCHGKDGQGLSSLMPPLTDTAYLSANKKSLACFIKYGLQKKLIIVNKKAFEGDMPAMDLAPIEIAEVLTYVTNSFGNNLGLITGEQVERDLKNCK